MKQSENSGFFTPLSIKKPTHHFALSKTPKSLANAMKKTLESFKPKLTVPKSPKLRTARRIRPHELSAKKKILQKFRHGHTHAAKSHPPMKLTKPKPFRFRTDARIHGQTSQTTRSPFQKSLLEKIKDFENQVPSRFKFRPDPSTSSKLNLKPTVPKEFRFRTDERLRYHSNVTTKVEQPKQFKARPLPKKVLNPVNVYKPPKRQPTIPQEFKLRTDSRKRKYTEIDKNEKKPELFKARPVPTKKFKLKKPKIAKITVPESPALNTKKRAQLHHTKQEENTNEIFVFKARPMPVGSPFQPKIIERPLTKPSPFQLESARLHEKSVHKFEKMMEEMEKENKRRAEFHAKPMLIVDSPFKPQKSDKPLTTITEFELNTEKRSIQRKEFETERKRKEQLVMEQMKQRKLQEELEKEKITKELRKRLVVKAKPMPKFKKPQKIVKSKKRLTVPVSPNIGKHRVVLKIR